ncbi:MAG: sulfatase-like hydrolase/transferase [Candidatus Aminicenantia bacterium]
MRKKRKLLIYFIIAILVLYAFYRIFPKRYFAKNFLIKRSSELNIILISVDTLRADRLRCYGFEGIETPNIDRLAEEGILFEYCYSHTPLTLPSHCSILTGTLPLHHRIRDNGGFTLDDKQNVVSELLKKKGFKTSAFVSAYVLDSKWGLNQGFDYYFDNFDLSKYKSIGLGDIQRRAEETINEAMNWIERNGDEKFFSFIHLYDPHTPYEPPPPYDKMYPNRPYLGEIAYTDFQIGRLIKFLEERNLLEKTIIIFLSDHGESLGEHREGTHGFFVYNAVLHVPLIVRTPFKSLRGIRVKSPVSLVHVTPTILDLANIPDNVNLQGESFLSLLFSPEKEKEAKIYFETFYPRYHFGWSELKGVIWKNWKFINAPKPELYDIYSDPAERYNLYNEKKEIVDKLKNFLVDIEDKFSSKGAVEYQSLDQETLEKLAALGYIGSFVEEKGTEIRELADPKDKIELFNLLISCKEDTLSGNYQSAIEKIEKILNEDPNIPDAHFSLGNVYWKMGDFEKAISAFKRALEINPKFDFAMINLANIYRILKKYDDALEMINEFLSLNPKDAQGYFIRGDIYLEKKEYDKALEDFKKSLSFSTTVADAYNGIGVIYYVKNELDSAEENIKKAIELNKKVRNAHFNLAQVYEKRGDIVSAIKEYEIETEYYPLNFKAHFNLGKLYGQRGMLKEQIERFRKTIEIVPDFSLGHLFLAKALMDEGSNLNEAIEHAKKGLSLKPPMEFIPLGHFILADIYNRMGRFSEAEAEYQKGKALLGK